MKRLCILIFTMGVSILAGAQQIEEVKFWIDGDFPNASIVGGPFTSEISNIHFPTNNLSGGFHTVSYMFRQTDGKWSVPLEVTFFKVPVNLTGNGVYEFWVDTLFSQRKSGTYASTYELILNSEVLDIRSIPNGFHTFYIRYKPNGSLWSNPVQYPFFKKGNDNISGSAIRKIQYWYDNDYENRADINTFTTAENLINLVIEDDEYLTPGNHQLCMQFMDNGSLWSSPVCQSIIKNVNEYSQKVFPKILINSNNYSIADNVIITGYQFRSLTNILLLLKDNKGNILQEITNFTANSSGELSLTISLPGNLKKDIYYIQAIDLTSTFTSNLAVFTVNSPLRNEISFVYPEMGSKGRVNSTINIIWKQELSLREGETIVGSNYIGKKYLLDYSSDGINWNYLTEYYKNNLIYGNTEPFSYLFTPVTIGDLYFRIKDFENPSNLIVSAPISISQPTNAGLFAQYEWDKSVPAPQNIKPKGLAADSVSRFIIKLKRSPGNVNPIGAITATIISENPNIPVNSIRLLGRISKAKNHNTYSLEADELGGAFYASSTSTTLVAPQGQSIEDSDLNFWICAPVDYALSPTDISGVRYIKVKFDIDYSNQTVTDESIITDNIEIVRPPLFFVHGLNSDSKAFDSLFFNLGTSISRYFTDYKLNIWKQVVFADMDPGGSFSDNAYVLLNRTNSTTYGVGYYNSYQKTLQSMHNLGYACNRLDYVGHSMGGCMGRMSITKVEYNPGATSGLPFKNYGRGFINKFITINTPHNGSPFADLVTEIIKNFNKITIASPFSSMGRAKIALKASLATVEGITNGGLPSRLPFIEGLIRKDNTTSEFPKYIASDAVKNLRYNNNRGEYLPESIVKNHLIGGDIIDIGDFNNLIENDFVTGAKYNEFLEYADKVIEFAIGLGEFIEDEEFIRHTKLAKGLNDKVRLLNIIFSGFTLADFIYESDFIVPKASQFPDYSTNIPVSINEDFTKVGKRSVLNGRGAFHTFVTGESTIGNRVMFLLNSSLLDNNYWASSIPANNGTVGSAQIERVENSLDSLIYNFEQSKINITNWEDTIISSIDSILTINVKISDTAKLKYIVINFQGKTYISSSKDSIQYFKIKNDHIELGHNPLVLYGVYDSSGFVVKNVDVRIINLIVNQTPSAVMVSSRYNFINPRQEFRIPVFAKFDSVYVSLNYATSGIVITPLDTNVVRYDNEREKLIAKDTGICRVSFSYQGLKDTSYIYISETKPDITTLPLKLTLFKVDLKTCNSVNVIWQTSFESELKEFFLESSKDGQNFLKEKTIYPKNQADGSHYEIDLNDLKNGNYYLRLKVLENDGTFSYTQVRKVLVKCESDISFAPNPVKDEIQIIRNKNDRPLLVKIIDVTGKIVLNESNFISNHLNLKHLVPGSYFIQFDNQPYQKFIKQ